MPLFHKSVLALSQSMSLCAQGSHSHKCIAQTQFDVATIGITRARSIWSLSSAFSRWRATLAVHEWATVSTRYLSLSKSRLHAVDAFNRVEIWLWNALADLPHAKSRNFAPCRAVQAVVYHHCERTMQQDLKKGIRLASITDELRSTSVAVFDIANGGPPRYSS